MNLVDTYQKLTEQEDSYVEQIQTCECCLFAICDHIAQYGQLFHTLAVRDIMKTILQIETNLREDLLQVRIDKAFVLHKMKRNA